MKRPIIVFCLLTSTLVLFSQANVFGQSKDLNPVNVKSDAPPVQDGSKESQTKEEIDSPTPIETPESSPVKPNSDKPIIMDFTNKKESESLKPETSSVSPQLDKKLEDLAKQQSIHDDKKEIEKAADSKPGKTVSKVKTGSQPVAKKKAPTLKLFGRLEQISAAGDVKMPVLKAMTAKLDPRGKKLKARVDETKYSGKITSFFPRDFQGTWGGVLKIWNYHWSPLYLKVDRKEAVQSVKILKKGRKGNVNFVFYRNSRGRTSLKPAEVLVSIPMKDSYTYNKMMKGSPQGQMAPFGNSFQDVMGNMEMPMVKINFGNFQTDGVMVTGISGNEAKQTVVKNVIRQLASNVLEQQIITKSVTKVRGTNRTNTGYAESVLRFKKLGHGKMYVLAATVNYTSKGGYLDKLIMYGNVNQGKLVQTNPMNGINGMMGNMMNLQKMFGMPTGQGTSGRNQRGTRANPYQFPGRGQIQGLPKNFNPNDILKRMNQQMGR